MEPSGILEFCNLSIFDVRNLHIMLVLNEHNSPIESLAFVNNYSYLASSSKGEMIVWDISIGFDEDAQAIMDSKSEENLPVVKGKINSSEDNYTSSRYASCKVFSTNLQGDYLIFLTSGSDIKIINSINGRNIGTIEGVHFKGTSSYGVLLNGDDFVTMPDIFGRIIAEANRIKELYDEDQYSQENEEYILDLFVEQLENYIFVTNSIKDKTKIWRFENGLSKMLSQHNSLGGRIDSDRIFLRTRKDGVIFINCGDASNRIELFTIKPSSL